MPSSTDPEAEADERTGQRDRDLVAWPRGREVGRGRGPEEVDDDRVGRHAPRVARRARDRARGPSPTRGTGSPRRRRSPSGRPGVEPRLDRPDLRADGHGDDARG